MTWRAQDGLAADLTAPTGRDGGRADHLSGGVRVTTSDGWAMTVPQVTPICRLTGCWAPAG
jgi:lipopolysaccharide export system protein LptC